MDNNHWLTLFERMTTLQPRVHSELTGPERYILPTTIPQLRDQKCLEGLRILHVREIQKSLGISFLAIKKRPRLQGRMLYQRQRNMTLAFGRHFTDNYVVVGCLESYSETDIAMPDCQTRTEQAYGVQTLIVPRTDNINVRIAFNNYRDSFYDGKKSSKSLNKLLINDAIDRLWMGDDGKDDTQLIMLFITGSESLGSATNILFKAIHKRFKKKRFPIWGAYSNDLLNVYSHLEDDNRSLSDTFHTVVRFTGDSLKCYTALLKCDDTKDQIYQKVQNFENSLKLRRCKILFLSGPTTQSMKTNEGSCQSNEEFRNVVTEIFPGVPLIATFYYHKHCVGNDGIKQKIFHKNKMSLMLMTYD